MGFIASLSSLAREALIFAVIYLVGVAITAVLRRTKLVRLEAVEGRTIVGGILIMCAVFGVLFEIAVVVSGIAEWEYTEPQVVVWGLLLVLIGASAALFVVLATGRWQWDSVGVTYADPFTGRQTIAWADMTEAAAVWHNVWRVRAAGKREICWSKWAIGWEKINEAVTLYRPDLAPMLDVRRALSEPR